MLKSRGVGAGKLTAGQIMLGTLVVAGVTGLVWLLVRWHDIVFLLFVAIVISTAIKPAVDFLQRKGLKRPAGIILVYLGVAAFFSLIIAIGAPLMADQGARIAGAVPEAYRELRESMLQTPNLFIWRLGLALPGDLSLSGGSAAAESEDAILSVRDSLTMLTPMVRTILGVLVTFVLAFYWTMESERLKRALLLLVPMDRREKGRELISTMEAQLGRYIVGQGLLMLSIAVLSFVGYLLLGLPYAFILALIAGLMEAVPLVGPALGAIPAALVAYSVNPSLVIWVIVFTLVVQQLENNILVPRIMRRSVGVNPLVTLLALTALSTLFGVTGALIAVPLAAIVQLLFFRYVVEREDATNGELEGRDELSVVSYDAQDLVRDLRRQARSINEADLEEPAIIIDDLENIAVELSDLLSNGSRDEAEETPA